MARKGQAIAMFFGANSATYVSRQFDAATLAAASTGSKVRFWTLEFGTVGGNDGNYKSFSYYIYSIIINICIYIPYVFIHFFINFFIIIMILTLR